MVHILTIAVGLVFLVFVGGMFIEANKEFMTEFADEHKYIKDTITKWYRGTRLFMWINNRKNGVTILSDRKYRKMLTNGKIKCVLVEEEG